jgi:hypothetical protein
MKAYTITAASKLHNFFINDALEGSGGWSLLPQVTKEELNSQNWRISAGQLFKMQFFSLPSVLVAKKMDAQLFKVCACTFAFSDQATPSRERQNPEPFFCLRLFVCLFAFFFFPTNKMESYSDICHEIF